MDNYPNYPPPPNPPQPTSMPDFNHHQLNHQRSPHPPPPPPPQAQWYPNQTHYQPTLQPQPPLPPGMQNQYPNHPQHWSPHPTENHAPQGYPPVPYHPHHQFPNGPPMHPPPYHVNQVPTLPYNGGHQEWENPNWTQHQGYEHPGQGNSDDWATRARAWAAAKTAMDSQHQQSTFPHSSSIRPESQTQYHYHEQYENVPDPQLEAKPGSHPVAFPHNPYGVQNYQQVPLTDGQSNNMPAAQQYGQVISCSASITSVPDNYLNKDGSLADESKTTVHQKEVPSSYSSSAGREAVTNQSQMQFSSYPGPGHALQGVHQFHPIPPAVDQPDLLCRPFSYHNQNGNLSDKPLDFAPMGNGSSVYPHHGNMYPSAANSGLQFGPSISAPSPVPGHVPPLFGTMTAPYIQPVLPSVSGPLGPSGLTSLVSATTFPVDAYGASSADRPRKAAVPNWLKEEIIKKKAVMATSAGEYCKEETQFEDEYHIKNDQAEDKSVVSLRSADEEEEDEDYVEAARTAAINKEIKRVLTEVLLKVTDDLFDEIATRVLSEEEEVTTEVLPAAALNQSSTKVVVPYKSMGTDAEKDTENPISGLPGGLLGLISYGTDSDDENDEIRNKKDESIRHGYSPDEKVDDDTKIMEKLDANSGMGAKNTDSFGIKVVDPIVSTTKESDRKQQDGISSLDIRNNVVDKERSNQDRTKEMSSRDSKIASDSIAAENKTSSQSSHATDAAVDRVRENKTGGRHEDKHLREGGLDDQNGPNDRKKDASGTYEKQKDLVSRKRSSHYDEKYKTERGRREGGRDHNRRGQLDDDKLDVSRHKHSSNSYRHKKGLSPSSSVKRKKNNTDSSASGGSSTNDESVDDSERKLQSKRRHRSPSPVRSRKRQISRSPENSQRRQSSYYSVESSRKKRSRSRSPRRRR